MLHFINSHGIELVAAYYVYSAAVSSMPPISSSSSALYKWLFGFTHVLSGDLNRYFSNAPKP